MRREKKNNKVKHQFRSYYCRDCQQKKPCHLLSWEKCCSCFYHQEREKAQEYTDYQQVYQQKVKEQQERIQQLRLLRNYQGCKRCESKEVDAYELYENNKLVCQSCRIKKEGGASSPVSFLEQQKWFKKWWKIDLDEWLTNNCLPVSANCAKKWSKDKDRLNNCQCLEQKAKEIHELFTNSLKEIEEKLNKCACQTSEKVRVNSDYYAWCETCEKGITAASKKRVIKNRNRFKGSRKGFVRRMFRREKRGDEAFTEGRI